MSQIIYFQFEYDPEKFGDGGGNGNVGNRKSWKMLREEKSE